MLFFRQLQKPTSLLWTLVLSITILCAQGVKLHVHNFDHEHGSHHDQIDIGNIDHLHGHEIHLANDVSHIDHHEGSIPELDVSPDGLLKKVSNSVLALAALALFLIVFVPRLTRETFQQYYYSKLRLSRPCYYSPPLRAPPQY